MFSTIKSIIKTLSVFSLFATLIVAGLSNVNASAGLCADGTLKPECTGTSPRNAGIAGVPGGNLTGPVCPATGCPLLGNAASAGIADRATVSNFILNFARFFIYIAAAISVLFIVYGGYLYIGDAGDQKRAETGKKVLINAVIGLAVCILAITIVSFIAGTLEGNLVGNIVNGK